MNTQTRDSYLFVFCRSDANLLPLHGQQLGDPFLCLQEGPTGYGLMPVSFSKMIFITIKNIIIWVLFYADVRKKTTASQAKFRYCFFFIDGVCVCSLLLKEPALLFVFERKLIFSQTNTTLQRVFLHC